MGKSSEPKPGAGRGVIRAIPYVWVVVPVALLSQMGGAWPGQGLPSLYPFIQEEFGLSWAQVGLITSVVLGGGIATVFLGGWLTDVLSVRRVMVISLVLLGLAMAGFPLVYSYPVLILLGVAIGVFEGPGYPVSTRAIMDWVPRRTRGLALGIKQTGVPLGGAIAAAILPSVAVALGWRVASVFLGGGILLVAIVFGLFYRDAPRDRGTGLRMSFATLRVLAQDRGLVMATIWGCIIVAIQMIVISYLILFIIDVVNVPKVVAAGYLAIAHVSSIVARIAWGAISDFLFGSRRNIVLGLLGMVATLGLMGISLVGAGPPGAILVLLVVVLGATTQSWPGLFAALVGELGGVERAGMALGAVNTVQRVAMIVGPPLFGLLVDVSDSYALAWRVSAVLMLAGTVALVVFGREPRRG